MMARSSFRFIGSAHHLFKQHARASGISLQQAVAAKAASVSSSRLGRAGLDSSTPTSGLAASHPLRLSGLPLMDAPLLLITDFIDSVGSTRRFHRVRIEHEPND